MQPQGKKQRASSKIQSGGIDETRSTVCLRLFLVDSIINARHVPVSFLFRWVTELGISSSFFVFSLAFFREQENQPKQLRAESRRTALVERSLSHRLRKKGKIFYVAYFILPHQH